MHFDHSDPTILAKRVLFLAYEASQVMGMGILRARPEITEDHVWANVAVSGDYPVNRNTSDTLHADYVFGRMMKLNILITPTGVTLPDHELNSEYQSWSSTYPTYEALLNAAKASL